MGKKGFVAFRASWKSRIDHQGIQVAKWCLASKTEGFASCDFCKVDINFMKKGVHALLGHSKTKKHEELSNSRFCTLLSLFLVRFLYKILRKEYHLLPYFSPFSHLLL